MGGGAPVGAARGTGLSPSGTFLLMNPPPAVILLSRIPGRWVQYTRHALDRPTAGRRSLPPPTLTPLHTAGPDRRPRRARVPSRNGEGNREGDGLELSSSSEGDHPFEGNKRKKKTPKEIPKERGKETPKHPAVRLMA